MPRPYPTLIERLRAAYGPDVDFHDYIGDLYYTFADDRTRELFRAVHRVLLLKSMQGHLTSAERISSLAPQGLDPWARTLWVPLEKEGGTYVFDGDPPLRIMGVKATISLEEDWVEAAYDAASGTITFDEDVPDGRYYVPETRHENAYMWSVTAEGIGVREADRPRGYSPEHMPHWIALYDYGFFHGLAEGPLKRATSGIIGNPFAYESGSLVDYCEAEEDPYGLAYAVIHLDDGSYAYSECPLSCSGLLLEKETTRAASACAGYRLAEDLVLGEDPDDETYRHFKQGRLVSEEEAQLIALRLGEDEPVSVYRRVERFDPLIYFEALDPIQIGCGCEGDDDYAELFVEDDTPYEPVEIVFEAREKDAVWGAPFRVRRFDDRTLEAGWASYNWEEVTPPWNEPGFYWTSSRIFLDLGVVKDNFSMMFWEEMDCVCWGDHKDKEGMIYRWKSEEALARSLSGRPFFLRNHTAGVNQTPTARRFYENRIRTDLYIPETNPRDMLTAQFLETEPESAQEVRLRVRNPLLNGREAALTYLLDEIAPHGVRLHLDLVRLNYEELACAWDAYEFLWDGDEDPFPYRDWNELRGELWNWLDNLWEWV